jgi:nucleotide-binding universal stress UspA family protein
MIKIFRKILVPTDGSALSLTSARAAIGFASEWNAHIVALCVARPLPALGFADAAGSALMAEEIMSAEDRAAQKSVAKIRELAEEAGVQCSAIVTRHDHPYEEIIAVAKKKKCDVIWIAPRSRNALDKLLLGSQTQRVLAHSAVPVIVYHKQRWEK